MRNQNLVGFKLPELSEAAEQDKGRLWGTCLLSLLHSVSTLDFPRVFVHE